MTVELNAEIEKHYTIPNLPKRIMNALTKVKDGATNYTRDDFSGFDEFHIQGKQATRELASLVPIKPNMKVLDIGCGVGGPVRTLASEFSADVYGIELVEEYFQTAKILSELLHMAEKTKFFHGSALALPFDSNSFDVVWMQHMNMNIEDKSKLFSEVSRVLKEDGKIALYEICKGTGSSESFYLPVPWANSETINHLVPTEEFISIIKNKGFKPTITKNVTEQCLKWFNKVLENAKTGKGNPLGLHLVSGDDFGLKAKNIVKNMEEKNIEVVMGVFER